MTRRGLWARCLGTGVLAAVAYGVVHDQISVRISPPYLMDWHPQIVASRDPTVVALVWGVVATWWFGLVLGGVLAFSATVGRRPLAEWRAILRAMTGVFVAAAIAATLAFGLFRLSGLTLPAPFLGPVYADLGFRAQQAFSQTAAMHEASYDAAGMATLVAAFLVYRERRTSPSPLPLSPGGERGRD